MMEYKFKGTAGSWKIFDAQGFDKYPGIETKDETKAIVCFGGEEWGESGVRGDTKDERNANAHLIAAAPDLLQACIDMLDNLRGEQRMEEELIKGLGAPVYSSMLRMQQAIHKALNIK